MYWPRKDSVSVVPRSQLVKGDMEGDKCSLKIGRQVYEGEILGIGEYIGVLRLSSQYNNNRTLITHKCPTYF